MDAERLGNSFKQQSAKVVLLLAGGYILGAYFSLSISFDGAKISPLWLPLGVAVGGLFVFGLRYCWVFWLANMAVLISLSAPLGPGLVVATVNTFGAVLVAFLMRKWLQQGAPLYTVKGVAKFFGVALFAPMLTAIVGPWATAGIPPWETGYGKAMALWWAGDVGGLLLATPVVLVILAGPDRLFKPLPPARLRYELLGLMVTSAGFGSLVFADPFSLGFLGITLAYGVLPLLLWACLRLGYRGGVFGLVGLALPATIWTSLGRGPFVLGDDITQGLFVLGFVTVGAALTLFLSAALAERDGVVQDRQILSRAVEQSATAVMIADAQGRIQYVNSAFTSLTGYGSGEVDGKSARFLQKGISKTESDQALWSVLSQGNTWRGDILTRRKDGGPVWEHTVISPLRNQSGQITHFVATAEDVTAQKQGEQQLRSALERTERARAELERITFAVTHTLQEPLRSISGFAQLLKKRYGTELDGNGTEYIDRVVEGADRMHHLFHDLMHYVLVDEDEPSETVDLAEVVRTAVFALGDEAQESTQIGSLPIVRGAKRQLVRVFEHLIANSMKYRHPERPLKVNVSLVVSGSQTNGLPISRPLENHAIGVEQRSAMDGWHICVEDNGIGLDPVFTPRLFTLFSRLHAADAYEGTGVGLAYCRRVIEHHGGSVWMDARPGEGVSVHMLLPKGNDGEPLNGTGMAGALHVNEGQAHAV